MRFFLFLWDFVVGDDWRAAPGVAAAIGAAAATVAAGANDWWLIPLGVAAILAESLRREARRAG